MEPQQGDQDILFRPFDKPDEAPEPTGRVRRQLHLSRPVQGCLVLILGLFILIGAVTFAADRICHTNLSQRLPLYPNATVTTRSHNLFTEFGMGNTVIVLTSPDDPDTVRSWYGVQTGSYLRDAVRNNTPFFRMAQGQWDVSRSQDGSGSQIILYGTCVQ